MKTKKKTGIILDSKVKCQNCDFTLALRNTEDLTITIPSDIDSLVQALDKDTTLITLQCKKCGCIVQIIS